MRIPTHVTFYGLSEQCAPAPNTLAKGNPLLAKALRDACRRPFTNSLLFNPMPDVMNLKPPFAPSGHFPLSPDYILLSQPPRHLHGTLTLAP